MRGIWIAGGLLVVSLAAYLASAQTGGAPGGKAPPPGKGAATSAAPTKAGAVPAAAPKVSPQEAAIRGSAKAFETSFNSKNAKAIAAQFTENGEMVEVDGSLTRGRQAIEDSFVESFEKYPDAKIEVTVEAVRFPSASMAIEEGFSKTKGGGAETRTPTATRRFICNKTASGRWPACGR